MTVADHNEAALEGEPCAAHAGEPRQGAGGGRRPGGDRFHEPDEVLYAA